MPESISLAIQESSRECQIWLPAGAPTPDHYLEETEVERRERLLAEVWVEIQSAILKKDPITADDPELAAAVELYRIAPLKGGFEWGHRQGDFENNMGDGSTACTKEEAHFWINRYIQHRANFPDPFAGGLLESELNHRKSHLNTLREMLLAGETDDIPPDVSGVKGVDVVKAVFFMEARLDAIADQRMEAYPIRALGSQKFFNAANYYAELVWRKSDQEFPRAIIPAGLVPRPTPSTSRSQAARLGNFSKDKRGASSSSAATVKMNPVWRPTRQRKM